MRSGQPPSALPSPLNGCPLPLQQNRSGGRWAQGGEAAVTSRCGAGPGNLVSQEVPDCDWPRLGCVWSFQSQPCEGEEDSSPTCLRMGV